MKAPLLARENESFQKIKVRVRCDLAIKPAQELRQAIRAPLELGQ